LAVIVVLIIAILNAGPERTESQPPSHTLVWAPTTYLVVITTSFNYHSSS